jgi:hypothetical protein
LILRKLPISILKMGSFLKINVREGVVSTSLMGWLHGHHATGFVSPPAMAASDGLLGASSR